MADTQPSTPPFAVEEATSDVHGLIGWRIVMDGEAVLVFANRRNVRGFRSCYGFFPEFGEQITYTVLPVGAAALAPPQAPQPVDKAGDLQGPAVDKSANLQGQQVPEGMPPKAITVDQAIDLWREEQEAHSRVWAFEWYAAGILAAERFHGIAPTPASTTGEA